MICGLNSSLRSCSVKISERYLENAFEFPFDIGLSNGKIFKNSLFASIGVNRDSSAITGYLSIVNKCEGSTLSKRIYNYLLGIGVKAKDMDTFIEMMTK